MVNLGRLLVLQTRARLSVKHSRRSYGLPEGSMKVRSMSLLTLSSSGPFGTTAFKISSNNTQWISNSSVIRRFSTEACGVEPEEDSKKKKYEYKPLPEAHDDLEVVLSEKMEMEERAELVKEIFDLYQEKINEGVFDGNFVPVRVNGKMKLVEHKNSPRSIRTGYAKQMGRIILRVLIEPTETKGELLMIEDYNKQKTRMETDAKERKTKVFKDDQDKEAEEKHWKERVKMLKRQKEVIRFWRGLRLAEIYVSKILRKILDDNLRHSRLCGGLEKRDYFNSAKFSQLLDSTIASMKLDHLDAKEQVSTMKSLMGMKNEEKKKKKK